MREKKIKFPKFFLSPIKVLSNNNKSKVILERKSKTKTKQNHYAQERQQIAFV